MVKHIIMIGTDFRTRGGISAVVNVYREHGLFDRYPVVYLATHVDRTGWLKLLYFARAWVCCMHLLLRRRAAVLHVHMATGASFWRKLCFLLPAYATNTPVILHLHSGDFDSWYEDGPRLRRFIARTVFDRAAVIIVLARSWLRWARSVTHNPSVVSIYNPVPAPGQCDPGLRQDAEVLFLGQLGRMKGTYDLLLAVARLLPAHPSLRLILAGDGEVERARREVCRLGLQRHVQVLDWVSGSGKAALLQRAAVYALPSYCEGLPMSVLEAMAAGVPVVTTAVGGIPEAVTDGCEGRLVEPGNVDALCHALDLLLSAGELRQRMGEAARNKVSATFAAERILPQIEQVSQSLGVRPCRR